MSRKSASLTAVLLLGWLCGFFADSAAFARVDHAPAITCALDAWDELPLSPALAGPGTEKLRFDTGVGSVFSGRNLRVSRSPLSSSALCSIMSLAGHPGIGLAPPLV